MKKLQLPNNQYTLVDDSDYDHLLQSKWCVQDSRGKKYVHCSWYKENNTHRVVKLHRLLLDFPEGVVDHINGDTLDNRRSNLRVCTRSENMQNRKTNANNTSGYKGVTLDKRYGKWTAKIGVGGSYIYLGSFKSKSRAAQAYRNASIVYHGEFAGAL